MSRLEEIILLAHCPTTTSPQPRLEHQEGEFQPPITSSPLETSEGLERPEPRATGLQVTSAGLHAAFAQLCSLQKASLTGLFSGFLGAPSTVDGLLEQLFWLEHAAASGYGDVSNGEAAPTASLKESTG
ncbi:unnamed protein product [Protopolystoma xenopodis]|uniref:Uncharacterized protein n=1 Tax=Protopolystoma xenopodis TaxID=117903 RepID=A0A448XE31_9PLAT|nr:unnamed protein product [Protopolystoma xenopodis]